MKIPMLDPRIDFEVSYKNFFKEFKNNILQEVRAKFGVQHPTLVKAKSKPFRYNNSMVKEVPPFKV